MCLIPNTVSKIFLVWHLLLVSASAPSRKHLDSALVPSSRHSDELSAAARRVSGHMNAPSYHRRCNALAVVGRPRSRNLTMSLTTIRRLIRRPLLVCDRYSILRYNIRNNCNDCNRGYPSYLWSSSCLNLHCPPRPPPTARIAHFGHVGRASAIS